MHRRIGHSMAKFKTVLTTLVYLTFTHVTTVSTVSVVRPEFTLLEVLGQPLVPTDAASSECLRDSAIYITALGNYTPWALQMYDASAKMPSGVITGNIKQLGNYDECLRVTNSYGFIGQACKASVSFDVHEDSASSADADTKDLLINVALASGLKNWTSGTTVTYEWTWCVPSTCTYQEIREKIDTSLDPLRVDGRVDMDVTMTENSCHTAETDVRKLDVADWIYITLLILFGLITIASTTIDLKMRKQYQEKRKDTKQIVLTSFSLYSNGKTLLNTNRRGDSIGCLDGLRYISICWIIYGHTHYLQVVGVQLDVSQVPVMHENWSTLLVLNGNIVTDTFFLLSGLLLAYTQYSQKQRNPGTTLRLFELYARRYFRLTPAYAMVIGFYATIYYKIGTGPEWDSWVSSNRDYCRENWWTNLLYVNNMVNVGTMCMSQTWYLAVDMQLVWLSPIFLYPMLKFTRPIIFWVILGLGLVISIAIPLVITYAMELTGTMIYYRDPTAVADVFLKIYTKTYARAGPYLLGLGLGYLLCKTKSVSIRIPRFYAISGWILAAILLGTVVFGPREMYQEDYVYDRLAASSYAGFHRTAFALAVSWIIFACVHGIAGPINGLLAWTGWMPLGKLTYSAYLSHYIVLTYNSGIVRTPGNLTPYTVVHNFFGNLVIVMCISLVVALVFEMPFMVLDNALRRSKRRQSDSKASSPPLAKLENENEIYKTIDDSVSSSVSQIYTDIADIGKIEDGTYVTNISSGSGYYVSEVEKGAKPENVYTYIIGSRVGTPQPERRYETQTSRTVAGPIDSRIESSEENLGSMENTRSNRSAGVDNRGYQV